MLDIRSNSMASRQDQTQHYLFHWMTKSQDRVTIQKVSA